MPSAFAYAIMPSKESFSIWSRRLSWTKPCWTGFPFGDKNVERILRGSPRGVSLVVDPMGSVIGKELQNEEGILYADIDLAHTVAPRQLQDVAGYYNRFDVFRLSVDRRPNKPAWFEDVSPT